VGLKTNDLESAASLRSAIAIMFIDVERLLPLSLAVAVVENVRRVLPGIDGYVNQPRRKVCGVSKLAVAVGRGPDFDAVLPKGVVEFLRGDHFALVVEHDLAGTLDTLRFARLVPFALPLRVNR
jgi:hypothetical protein